MLPLLIVSVIAEGTVFFADIEKDSYLVDLNKVEGLIRSKPSGFFTGIIPVDFAGRAVNLEECRSLADKYDLWILEDACHAPGGYFIRFERQKRILRQWQVCRAGYILLSSRKAYRLWRRGNDHNKR